MRFLHGVLYVAVLISVVQGTHLTSAILATRAEHRHDEVFPPKKPTPLQEEVQKMDRPPFSFSIIQEHLAPTVDDPDGRVACSLRVKKRLLDGIWKSFDLKLKAIDSRGAVRDYTVDFISLGDFDARTGMLYLCWEQATNDHTPDGELLSVDVSTRAVKIVARLDSPMGVTLSPSGRYLLSRWSAHASAGCCQKWELINLMTHSRAYLEAGSQDSEMSQAQQMEREGRRYRWTPKGRLALEVIVTWGEKEGEDVWRLLQTFPPSDPSLAWKPIAR